MASLVDVRKRLIGLRPEARVALGLTAVLLIYGNASAVVPHDTREQFLLWSNLSLLALLLAWAIGPARLSVQRSAWILELRLDQLLSAAC